MIIFDVLESRDSELLFSVVGRNTLHLDTFQYHHLTSATNPARSDFKIGCGAGMSLTFKQSIIDGHPLDGEQRSPDSRAIASSAPVCYS